MTIQEMCEKIAAEIERRGRKKLDPQKDIWEADNSGGIMHVYELYWSLFPDEAPDDVKQLMKVWEAKG